jgi:hypothetical protein
MNLKQLIKKAPWKQAQANYGPTDQNPGGPVSPQNAGPMRQLENCTISIVGSSLVIDNKDVGVTINLTNEQLNVLLPEFDHVRKINHEKSIHLRPNLNDYNT